VGGTQYTARHRQETVNALQAEVARLERAQSLQRAADSAINSLQDKISDLKVGFCSHRRLNVDLAYRKGSASVFASCGMLYASRHRMLPGVVSHPQGSEPVLHRYIPVLLAWCSRVTAGYLQFINPAESFSVIPPSMVNMDLSGLYIA